MVKIQAFIRANKARDDYKTLSESTRSLHLCLELVLWVARLSKCLSSHSQRCRSSDGGGEEVRPPAGPQRPGLPGGVGADAAPRGGGHQHPLQPAAGERPEPDGHQDRPAGEEQDHAAGGGVPQQEADQEEQRPAVQHDDDEQAEGGPEGPQQGEEAQTGSLPVPLLPVTGNVTLQLCSNLSVFNQDLSFR